MTHFRFHERFRWPVDQVLVIGLGMVALPVPVDNKPNLAGHSAADQHRAAAGRSVGLRRSPRPGDRCDASNAGGRGGTSAAPRRAF